MLRPQRLGYVSLNVQDMERSVEFWTKAVHLEVTTRRDDKVFLRGGKAHHWIVLQESDTPGLERVALEMSSLEDLDGMEQRLSERGVAVESGDGLERDRVERYLRFNDPSGIPLELYVDMLSMPTSPRPTNVEILDIQHVVLGVDDVKESAEFYTNVIGMRVSDWIERTTVFTHFRNGWHHGIGLAPLGSRPRLTHICFQPPDLDNVMRTRAAVKKMGLPITLDILRHGPSGSVGFYFLGPDTVVEFSFGARLFGEDEEFKPRVLAMSDATRDVWQTGLEDNEMAIIEDLGRIGSAPQPVTR